MEFKDDIKRTLKELKTLGVDRRKAEIDLGYGEFSIDAEVSRGGNKKMLAALNLLLKNKILEKTISELIPQNNKRYHVTEEPEQFQLADDYVARVDAGENTREVIGLRAITDVLAKYVLEMRANYYGRPLRDDVEKNGVENEFEKDVHLLIQQLKKQ